MTGLNAPELITRKKGAEDRLNWLQKNDKDNPEIQKLQTYIANLNVQIDKAQNALEKAQTADQEIAAYETAIAQIEAERREYLSKSLKTSRKLKKKLRSELMQW